EPLACRLYTRGGRDDVRRQDPERLDQADEQPGRDHEGDDLHKVAENARQQHQGCEGRDCREHGGGHRLADFPQRVERSLQSFFATLQPVVHRLHDHDSIVHEHSEDDDDAEQDGNVQRVATDVQEPKSACDGERNAERYEESDSNAEEDPAYRKYQEQAEEGVPLHHRQCLARLRRLVIREVKIDACPFHLPIALVDVLVDTVDELQRVGECNLGDRHRDSRTSVEADQLLLLLPAATDLGNAVESDLALWQVLGRYEELSQFLRQHGFPLDTDQPGFVADLHLAGRHVPVGLPELIRDIRGGEPIRGERLRVYFDLQFRFIEAERLHAIDAGEALQFVTDDLCLAP